LTRSRIQVRREHYGQGNVSEPPTILNLVSLVISQSCTSAVYRLNDCEVLAAKKRGDADECAFDLPFDPMLSLFLLSPLPHHDFNLVISIAVWG